MLGVGLAVAGAVAFAFTNYYLRLGSRDLRQGSVTAWSSVTGCLAAVLIAVAFRESFSGIDGWGWVSIAGIAAVWFVIGRYLMVMGLRLIGLSLTGPMMGTIPVWALLLTFLFLDDKSWVDSGGGRGHVRSGPGHHEQGGTVMRQRTRVAYLAGIGAALGAAMAFGGAQVLTSATVETLSPLVVLAIAQTIALAANGVLFSRDVYRDIKEKRRGYSISFLAGTVSTVAFVLVFSALKEVSVVVVAPIVAGGVPIFSMALSMILLRRAEKMTRGTFVGAALVVGGALLVTTTSGL